jgi:hypothetical protein
MSISNHLSKKFYKALESGNLEECKGVYQMSLDMKKPFDLHQDNEYLFLMACYNNKLNVAKWLYEQCMNEGLLIDIYAQNSYAFNVAHDSQFNELYGWLYRLHIDNLNK